MKYAVVLSHGILFYSSFVPPFARNVPHQPLTNIHIIVHKLHVTLISHFFSYKVTNPSDSWSLIQPRQLTQTNPIATLRKHTSMASTGATPPPTFPTLQLIDLASPPAFAKPSKLINEGHDVARFLTSLAYRDIGTFILQLNHALCPRHQSGEPLPRLFPLVPGSPTSTPSIRALQTLLAEIDGLVQQAPPDPGPRRFGNVSFRKWFALVEGRLDDMLSTGLLGTTLDVGGGTAREEVGSYLLGSFGSAQRLDYGTGHELSFIAFVGCLWKLGFFKDGTQGGDIEREIVLDVIEPYVQPSPLLNTRTCS